MSIDFDFDSITSTEFGVGLEENRQRAFFVMNTDAETKKELGRMLVDTKVSLENVSAGPALYSPAEKYSDRENLYLPVADEMVAQFVDLHTASNLPTNDEALEDKDKIFCYFARFTDGSNRQVTAIRRASQFKSIGRRRVVWVIDDTLTVVDSPLFKLDHDFDFILDANRVHILRPRGLEFIGRLQEQILAAVSRNISVLAAEASYVDWQSIADYASSHTRAARYLASVRSAGWARNVDRRALVRLCRDNGVDARVVSGRVSIDDSDVIGFLEVLDRRRYGIALVAGTPENFRATSRRQVNR